MTSKTPKSRAGKRPGTAMRGDLQDAYEVRGNSQARLYTSFSVKTSKDVVLANDLKLLHFFLRDSDPDVVNITFQPTERSDKHGELCSVEYISRDKTLHVESVKYSRGLEKARIARITSDLLEHYPPEGKHPLGEYARVTARVTTEQDIVPGNETRLRNWNRLAKRFAETRFFSLAHAERLLMASLERGKPQGLCELVLMASEQASAAQSLSAAIKAWANGECCSDLDVKPFSMRSSFWLRGRA